MTRLTPITLLSLALMTASPAMAKKYAEEVIDPACDVADNSGTPLNVRATPQGKIVRTLPNETLVHMIKFHYDKKGREWVQIKNAQTGKYYGWVVRDHLACN